MLKFNNKEKNMIKQWKKMLQNLINKYFFYKKDINK